MILRFRIAGLVLASALATTGAPALAAAQGKCKVSMIAKLPVVMQGPRASVPVSINGQDERVWLDSGAFFNFMPKARAVELGLKTEPLPLGFYMRGIGGSYTPELARVRDFGILGITLHNMQFLVGGSDSGNGFIGANLLGRWDTEFDLAKGAVNIFEESNCGKVSMAYWGAGMAINEARLLNGDGDADKGIYVEVSVNGRPLRALLDSGAPTSILYRHAATRAGINLDAPEVVGSFQMSGVGANKRQSWIARTQTIAIGGEEIRNSPIRVIDDSGDTLNHDMLLGVDFLMSHHVITSRPQRIMFLTYNGGPIFSATTERELGRMETRAENMGAQEKTVDPKTADDFAGRASGRLLRGDAAGAIADYGEAIKLAPARAELYSGRADAYLHHGQGELAAKDIDAALAIRPDDYRLLTRRAQFKLRRGDMAGARADTDAAAAHLPRGSLAVLPVVSLYERLGAADRGLALIDAVVDLHRDDSEYPALLNARSWNRALANADLDRALKDIDTAIKKGGAMPGWLDTRALVQFRRKDFAAAIADETAALAKLPRLPAALFVRGLARLASGDSVGGKADLAAAREIQPAIDRRYAAYGLVDPAGSKAPAVQDESDD